MLLFVHRLRLAMLGPRRHLTRPWARYHALCVYTGTRRLGTDSLLPIFLVRCAGCPHIVNRPYLIRLYCVFLARSARFISEPAAAEYRLLGTERSAIICACTPEE